MMKKNIIIIPPCLTYGDTTSIFSLIFFLLEYYKYVYLYLGEDGENYRALNLLQYCNSVFKYNHLFNLRIFIIEKKDTLSLLDKSKYGEYHICEMRTGAWVNACDTYKNHKSIDPQFYYNFENPLYNNILDLSGQQQMPSVCFFFGGMDSILKF